jgi:hypothetical protein
MSVNNDKNQQLFDALTSWMESSEGLGLEELRAVRRQLGQDVENSEQEFLAHLRELRSGFNQRPLASADNEIAPSLSGLLERANNLGLDPTTLADRTELSVSLVTKLDRRLIALAHIPIEVLETLASALQSTTDVLRTYLQQTPAFAKGARYRSNEKPAVPEQQDFFEAVKHDRSISEERRQQLLQLKDRNQRT